MEPIRKTRLYEKVMREVQRYIQKNGLVPGDRLMSERDFATELAVSRTSVRQALTVMSYLGLVDIRPGEGVFVGHSEEALDSVSDHGSLLDGIFDKGITLDLLEARRILECGVAPLIIDRVTEDDITELKNLVDKYEKDLEDHGLVTTRDDIEFHTKVVQLCQNDYLINIYIQISRVWLRSSRDSMVTNPPGEGSLVFHKALICALENRDVDALKNAIEEHTEHVRQVIISGISKHAKSPL